MTYGDLLDLCMVRAQRLGLVDEDTGKVDAAELELYLFQALLDVSEIHDIEAYTVTNNAIAITTAGDALYRLPTDYGRLVSPRVQNKRGIYLWNGVQITDLEYLDPNAFTRLYFPKTGAPKFFTVARRNLSLSPTPDDNSGRNYTVRGIYIERISRPDLDAEVLLSYPSVLVDVALFRLAGDMGQLTEALAATRGEGLSKLVGGPLGQVSRIAASVMKQPAKANQT